ncbi:UNVERIFIED_CONTAM: hypothetical protein K2H54_029129 [Gekko kuhli]
MKWSRNLSVSVSDPWRNFERMRPSSTLGNSVPLLWRQHRPWLCSWKRETRSGGKVVWKEMELVEEKESSGSVEASTLEDLGPQEEPVTFNPLLRAALTGNTEGVQQIFDDPEDPDREKATELLMEKDIVGRDLLYATCMAGKSDVIRILAKYGVDLKDKTARGYTLLHCAAAWGQLETLKTLVELDADIFATTFRGEKARDIAYRYEQTECVEFLDWAGDFNARIGNSEEVSFGNY